MIPCSPGHPRAPRCTGLCPSRDSSRPARENDRLHHTLREVKCNVSQLQAELGQLRGDFPEQAQQHKKWHFVGGGWRDCTQLCGRPCLHMAQRQPHVLLQQPSRWHCQQVPCRAWLQAGRLCQTLCTPACPAAVGKARHPLGKCCLARPRHEHRRLGSLPRAAGTSLQAHCWQALGVLGTPWPSQHLHGYLCLPRHGVPAGLGLEGPMQPLCPLRGQIPMGALP